MYVLHVQLKKKTTNPHNKKETKPSSSIESPQNWVQILIIFLCSIETVMSISCWCQKSSEEKFMGKFYFLFYRDLKRKSNQVQNCKAKIELLGTYDPQKQLIIEDPYYVCVRNYLGGLIKNSLCIVYNLSRSHSWHVTLYNIWCYIKPSVNIICKRN